MKSMEYKQSTQVPNVVFDIYLPTLTESEIKVLLIIIRQTHGWVNKATGGRKERDRISGSQFREKTKLSKRAIINAIQSLSEKKLIEITDYNNNPLCYSADRKGKKYLYYRMIMPDSSVAVTSAKSALKPVHKRAHNKTNYTKLNNSVSDVFDSKQLVEILAQRFLKSKLT